MVRWLACILMIAFLAPAQERLELDPAGRQPLHPDEYEGGGANYAIPRPYRMAAIKSIVIRQNGGWSDNVESDETVERCLKFTLTEHDVRDFFKHANRISAHEYWQDASMSRCYAYGSITFTNGDSGEWRVDAMRRGRLKLSDGWSLYFLGKRAHAKNLYEFSPEHGEAARDELPPFKMPSIKSIVLKPGGTTWTVTKDQAAGLCNGFELREGDVQDYFRNATQVSFRRFVSELKSSPCSVEGEVTFTDGERGKWTIERARRGVLILSDGRTVYLNGKNAHAKAFLPDHP